MSWFQSVHRNCVCSASHLELVILWSSADDSERSIVGWLQWPFDCIPANKYVSARVEGGRKIGGGGGCTAGRCWTDCGHD